MNLDTPLTQQEVKELLFRTMSAREFQIEASVTERNFGEDWSVVRKRHRCKTQSPHSKTTVWKAVSSWSTGSVLEQWYNIPDNTTDAELHELFQEFDAGVMLGTKGKIRLSTIYGTACYPAMNDYSRLLHVALLEAGAATVFKLKYPVT
ncbi:hypothetical protein AB3G45_19670 [Shinella sp. S4-D37]|uniref:hypothetical protein n=1 Tax=Shinella sp. S4-D37 TaxID=3161999 RepID=UPI0034661348